MGQFLGSPLCSLNTRKPSREGESKERRCSPSPPLQVLLCLHLIQRQRLENEMLQSNNPCVSTEEMKKKIWVHALIERSYGEGWEFMANSLPRSLMTTQLLCSLFTNDWSVFAQPWSRSWVSLAHFESTLMSSGIRKHHGMWGTCRKGSVPGRCPSGPRPGYKGRTLDWRLLQSPRPKVEANMPASQGCGRGQGGNGEESEGMEKLVLSTSQRLLWPHFPGPCSAHSSLASFRKHISSHLHLFL